MAQGFGSSAGETGIGDAGRVGGIMLFAFTGSQAPQDSLGDRIRGTATPEVGCQRVAFADGRFQRPGTHRAGGGFRGVEFGPGRGGFGPQLANVSTVDCRPSTDQNPISFAT